jgi:hypothetical protein
LEKEYSEIMRGLSERKLFPTFSQVLSTLISALDKRVATSAALRFFKTMRAPQYINNYNYFERFLDYIDYLISTINNLKILK